jgi:hypothetical protein
MDEGTFKTPIPKCRLYWCFYFGWCGNFEGSESGQKQNMVYNTTHYPPPPTQPYTVCIYCTFTFGKGGGVEEVREKVERQQFTRGGENTNMTDCISDLYTLLHQ